MAGLQRLDRLAVVSQQDTDVIMAARQVDLELLDSGLASASFCRIDNAVS